MHFGEDESEAETVGKDDGSRDATLELRRMMGQLIKGRKSHRNRYVTGVCRSANVSPTAVTDPDAATLSSSETDGTRCVCKNARSEGCMIQWYDAGLAYHRAYSLLLLLLASLVIISFTVSA